MVPVTTCPLTVVVTVAGRGEAVEELRELACILQGREDCTDAQADQIPVHCELGPQTPDQLDHALHPPSIGPPDIHAGPKPPGPPMPGPPRPPGLPQGPPEVKAVGKGPPDVAEKVASGAAVGVVPAFAQIWATAP